MPFRRLAQGLGLFALSSALSLALAEVVVRKLSPMPVFGPVFDLRPYHKLMIPPGLKGVSAPAVHSANKWGMRGEDPPRDWADWETIVAIGGSTTQCFHLDDHKTWPFRLQEKLRAAHPRTWVGNAGLDGHTTRAHRLMMERVIGKIRPKTILVLAGLNDLWLSLEEERRAGGSPYDNGFVEKLNRGGARAFLLNHSRLCQVLYIWKRVLSGEVVTLEKAYHKNWYPTPLAAPEDSVPPDAELLPSLPRFRDNLLAIDSMAREWGIRAVFLTQPILYGDGPEWRGLEARHLWIQKQKYRISAATERRLLDVFNGQLLSLCATRGLECVDLAARMPRDSAYYYDDCHFNDAGAERVADIVAAHFLGAGP